jgi:hypothetical protein
VSNVRIRPGIAADAPLLLALFDEAVAWLVTRGQPGQWGDGWIGQVFTMRL